MIRNNTTLQEENELKKTTELLLRNYRLIITCIIICLGLAYVVNRFSLPVYKISSSILIREHNNQNNQGNVNNYLNSNLIGQNQNLQNELSVIKSSPVIDQTIKNLDLQVKYFRKVDFRKRDSYNHTPFRVSMIDNHSQPVNVDFKIIFLGGTRFRIEGKSKEASFYNFMEEKTKYVRNDWSFSMDGEFGKWIETEDIAIELTLDSTMPLPELGNESHGFTLNTIFSLNNEIKNNLEFKLVDRLATVIEIRYKSESVEKGTNIVNEIMNVYSQQNLNRKNHIANITIDLIERQLDEISDSLIQTEDNLMKFRSSNQVLNITDQASGLTTRYLDLQNQLAEMMSRKRYYDYVSDYLIKNDNFSNMLLPAAMGISDQMLNSLISELISAQAQQSNLIENNQEKNPLVPKLGIKIENLKETISQNITAVGKTTSISIDEMNNRINKMETDISRLPSTQRKLGTIERKYRLNDAIYNYLLEKRAEAKITQASNLPDDLIIEPAGLVGIGPVTPNIIVNYLIAFFLGIFMPYGFLTLKSILNNQIDSQEDMERLVNVPVLGNILHNTYKTRNIMREFQKSNIAESFRALRTNLDFYLRGGNKKVILVSSCIQGEGKTFIATNLAISYGQLGRKTILVSFDLRKSDPFFRDQEIAEEGLSSYLAHKAELDAIIIRSPHDNLDYIPAGILPPNPVELIALDRTSALMTELRTRYDVIIIDTTPLAQFSDAYLLFDHSDLKVIIARQNFSMKKIFSNVMKDLNQKNINNICIVLNDNRMYLDKYGYGYRYNYKDHEKKFKKSKNGGVKNLSGEKVAKTILN